MSVQSILVPLAPGFEEIEGITIIDILRRANFHVVTAGVSAGPIEASRKTRHLPDVLFEEVFKQDFDAVVLPGGQPGTNNLKADVRVRECVLRHFNSGKWVAAICAAPTVLHDLGLLHGKKATSHPSVREILTEVNYLEERVVVDGKIVTSRGAGSAMEFAFKLVELFSGEIVVQEVNQGVLAKI
jgi:4-methyl-5(b-hydroxyethyl)-thiazole monophosphate biosynthesis